MGKNVHQISTKLEAHVVGGVNPGSMSERERARGLKKSYCPLAGVAINANAKARYITDDMCVRYEDISKAMPTSGSSGTLKGYYKVRLRFISPAGTVFYGSSYDILFYQHYSGGLDGSSLFDITTSQAVLIEGYETDFISVICSSLRYKVVSTSDIVFPTKAFLYYYADQGSQYEEINITAVGGLDKTITANKIDSAYKAYGVLPDGSGTQADPYVIVLHFNIQ